MSPLGWMESCKPLPNQRQMVPGLRLTQVLSSTDSYCELTPCWRQSSTNHNACLVLTFFLPSFPWCCPLHFEAVACYHAWLWDSTTWIIVVSTRRSRCQEDSLPMAPLVVYAMRRCKTESSFLTPSVSRSWTVQPARWRKQNSRYSHPFSCLSFPRREIWSKEMPIFAFLEGQSCSVTVLTCVLDTNPCSRQENHVQSQIPSCSLNIWTVSASFFTPFPQLEGAQEAKHGETHLAPLKGKVMKLDHSQAFPGIFQIARVFSSWMPLTQLRLI